MFALQKISLPKTGLYVVRRNQTVKEISKYFEIPEHIIVLRNHLAGEVSEGDALFLPSQRQREYYALPGETVESICRKFDVSIELFCELNGVDYVWPHMRVLLP